MPPIFMSPMPASPTLTQQKAPTPLTLILSLAIYPPALAHSPTLKNLVLLLPPPGLSSADPTLPSTRRTTQTTVVSQHPWSPSPFPPMPSLTTILRRRWGRLVSRVPLSPRELGSLQTSNWKHKARTQRPPAPVPTEIACARCILAQLLPLPQRVDPRIVYPPLARRVRGGGKPRMTRKLSLGLLGQIKDHFTITFLPKFRWSPPILCLKTSHTREFRTDELGRISHQLQLIGFAYTYLSYTINGRLC